MVRIYALFGVLFTGLNNVAVYQNGQISGMSNIERQFKRSHICENVLEAPVFTKVFFCTFLIEAKQNFVFKNVCIKGVLFKHRKIFWNFSN